MAVIEPGSFIVDCVIGEGVHVKAGSYLESSQIGSQSEIGPYAHLRPDSIVGEDCKVGNFVEMKKVKFGNKSKGIAFDLFGRC